MGGDEHRVAVARSRAALLEEIGDGHDLVFVRGFGNIGDELIWAGTRRLLEGHVYREIGVDELASSSGDTALISGGGAWCRAYNNCMPRVLALAELRFERVIVLPSSFDAGEDRVREALMRTEATVFAREPESFAAITGMCRARAAHDCAFFFDFSGYPAEGTGTLNAFRTDDEATEGELQVTDNDDVSLTCESLEAWLDAIARHAIIRTDRAHVMIAAALMGKEVEFAPNSYHKVQSIAEGSLHSFTVRQVPAPRTAPAADSGNERLPAPAYERLRRAAPARAIAPSNGPPRITAAILSRNRPELVAAAVHSVTEATVPVLVLVIDNNSDSPTRRILFDLAAEDTRVDVRLAHRNLGTAAGRRLASELVETEFVLFLDDDAELMPGALESLLTDLDAHPEAAGVTGLVVEPDGIVHHCGGSMAVSEERVTFTLEGAGLEFDDFRLPPTGPAGWAPGTASLFRAEALREFLIDEEMTAYYEDNEWCYRVELARPGSFRRCREALVLHHLSRGGEHESQLITCSEKVEKLLAQAHFLHAHGRLLDVDLLWLVPELRRPDWSLDTDAARLLLELIAARGTDWATMAWCSGELEPLLGRARVAQELEQAKEQAQAHEAALATLEQRNQTLEQRNDTLLSIEAGGWWRLRSRLLPLLRLASVVRDFSGARS